MSMSPDDPNFLSGLNNSLTNGLNSPLMGIAMGLLRAGGPSRMPTSFGQALAQGIGTGQQFQQQGIQNALQQIQLQQARQGQQYFNNMLNPQAPAAASQVPAAIGTDTASAANGLSAPQPAGAVAPSQAPAAQPPAAQQPSKPQLPALMDPTQDPRYLALNKQAMIAKHFGLDSSAFDNQARALLDNLTAQEITLTPDQAKLLIPGGTLPGQSIKYKPYTGDWSVAGEASMGTVPVMTPAGTMANVPYDKRTGQINDVGHVLTPKDYSKPLSPSMEQQAQAVSQYRQLPPTVSSRDPGAADIRGRANYLITQTGGPGLDDTTFPSKMAAMKSLSAGKDYQQNSAYSTIQTHMATLDQAMQAVDNGDIQGANKLTQWAGKQFGKSAPQNAKVVNDIVVGELAKVLGQGGQVTDAVRNEAAGMLEPYLSKGQYQGATQYIRQLIAGKMATSHINAQANHIPDDVFMSHLSPEARDQLSQFEAQHPNGAGASANTGRWTYDPATGKMTQQ